MRTVSKENLIDVKEDGSYRLNTAYFGYLEGLVMTNQKFEELFDGPARQPEPGLRGGRWTWRLRSRW